MEFFQIETTRALMNFVSQFQHSATYEAHIVTLIRHFAGGDDVGLVLDAILKKYETSFGNNFTTPFRSHCLTNGRINGVAVLIRLQCYATQYVPGAGGAALQWQPEDNIVVKTTDGKRGTPWLEVATTTVANWNGQTRRRCLMEALLVHIRNNRCKYCDDLLINEGMCGFCSTRVGVNKCHFCMSKCGIMEHNRLKRGREEPKVYFHLSCKKRKLFMF